MRFFNILLFIFSPISLLAGTISISSTTLPSFGNVYTFQSSVSQRLLLSASALSNTLQIQAPNGYEVSLQYRQGYTASLSITPQSGNINSTNIYIRFSPSSTGLQSGVVNFISSGSTTQILNVTGTGIAWSIPTSPTNYYSTATGNGASLKTALYNRITGHSDQGYTPGVWNAFYTTDVQPNGKVWDIYSTRFDTASPYEFTLGTNQDNGTGGTSEGQKYNREHSFPQSYFANAAPMVSDVHHIFATDKRVNAQRGDLPYGTVATPNWTSLIGGKRGPNTSGTYLGDVFEPIDEYKGDLARAYFYLATRYENIIGGWSANTPEADAILLANNPSTVFEPWFLNLLINWHNLDPVSDKEIKRNNAIFAIQNNRNPFIDSPHFVRRIWGGALPVKPSVNSSNLIISSQTNTSFKLNWTSGNGNNRLVVIRPNTSPAVAPADSLRYIANTIYGSGSTLGNNNFVVYNGTGSTVTVTGLTIGTTYNVIIYEYNGWYQTSNYQTSGALSSNANTLPVTWVVVSANKISHETIRIDWETASEINNEYFSIERSIDAISFENIANVKGQINYNGGKYVFIHKLSDNEKQLKQIYYRIKQTDFDGLFSYSNTVSVLMEKQVEAIISSPNPFSEAFSLTFTNKLQLPVFKLSDINGKEYKQPLIYEQTDNQINFYRLHDLPAGYYCLQIQTADGNIRHIKLIKQ